MSSNVVSLSSRTANRAETGAEPTKPKFYLDPVARLEFIERVAEIRDLKPTAHRAVPIILSYYNHHDGCARPSTSTLAKRLGTSRQSVSEAVQQLAERGLFRVEADRKGNRNAANRYFPLLDRVGLTVGNSRQSNGVTVGERRHSEPADDGFTVGICPVSLSAEPDTNPVIEPSLVDSGDHEEDRAGYAHPRESRPGSFDGDGNDREPVQSQDEAIELPSDWKASEAAVEAARSRGCTDAQIEASEIEWRKRNAGQRRTLAEWDRTLTAWMNRERPKSMAAASKPVSVEKVPLPADYQFPADAITAAKAKGLKDTTIEKAMAGFRTIAGDGRDTLPMWGKRAAAYLNLKEEKQHSSDELVWIGDIMTGRKQTKLAFVEQGCSYTDSQGVRHTKPGQQRSRYAL